MLSIIIFIFSPMVSCFMRFYPQQWKLRASSGNKWNFYYNFMFESVWLLRSFATTCEAVLSWGHAFSVAPPVIECLIASFIYYYVISILPFLPLYIDISLLFDFSSYKVISITNPFFLTFISYIIIACIQNLWNTFDFN